MIRKVETPFRGRNIEYQPYFAGSHSHQCTTQSTGCQNLQWPYSSPLLQEFNGKAHAMAFNLPDLPGISGQNHDQQTFPNDSERGRGVTFLPHPPACGIGL
jgi:hypothetical protein